MERIALKRVLSYVKQTASPGSLHETGCSGLVHWDDPEGWDEMGEGLGMGEGLRMGEKKVGVLMNNLRTKPLWVSIKVISPKLHAFNLVTKGLVIQTIEPRSSCVYNIPRDVEYLGDTSVLSHSFYIIIENSSRLSDLAKIRSLLYAVCIFNL